MGLLVVMTAVVTLVQVAVGPAESVAIAAADPVLLAAGDIASCAWARDDDTAAILDANPGATIQTLGDNVYDNGTASEFTNCYGPNWGRSKLRTMPASGNHEYGTANASGYYGYFGTAAGDPTKGWYSYNLGGWHIVVLNSNCASVGGCGAGSPQEAWLRADLAAHPRRCTLAAWHHPRFASVLPSSSMQAIWQALSDYSADVVLAGHQHNYERFALLGPTGSVNANGIRSFIVGTGGASLASFGSATTGSQVRNASTFGVLKLTLRPEGYEWAFLPIAGQTFSDTGAEACRPTATDTTPPTPPTNLTATTPPNRVDLSWEAASDNVGLAGYDILRNGATLATVGATTSYSDTTVAPLTTYTYEVRARDASGNLSPPSNAVTVTTPEAPRIHTYTPVADSRVQEGSPTSNYGSQSLGVDAGPAVETYLRFDVSGLSGAVQSARVRLYASNGSADGPSVRKTANAWGETTLNWSNRPAPVGTASDDRGAIPTNAYTEWDVTPLVAGDGTVSFVLAQPGTDGSDFLSRESSANKPELIVAVTGTPPPPDTSPPSKPTGLNAAASPGRVDLAWEAATDDVAVTAYEIFRNGALLTTVGAVTSYADATVAPVTAYTYEVRARDAAHNLSQFSDPASVTTVAAPQTLTFAPVADAQVQEANPATNYGASALRTDAGPAVETNLRFDLGTLPGEVQSAKLRVHVTAGSVDGPAVYPTGTGWTESGVTWANRPARTGAASDDRASLGVGYAEWDVTSLIPASGSVGFVLAQTSTDGVDYSSKEAATNRPQLVVTVVGDPPPPDGTPPSTPTGLTATASAGRVDLAWEAATDDVGVTGYDVFRNGTLLASTASVTTYADTTVAPNSTYTYEVRARDGAGNVSALSDQAEVTTPAAPQVLTFPAIADARVEAATPGTNFGSATLTGTDASPAVDTYVTFDVSGIAGTVQSARLRLYASNGSVDGPAVHQTAAAWSEASLTWANRPSPVGAASDDRAAVAKNAFVEWSVTPFVTANGRVSFVLTQPGTDGADFQSREGTILERRPQLVVNVAP